jgi:hypothetical protein
MELNHTTTLSATDAAQSEQLFKSVMAEDDLIKVIVFGNTDVSQQAIKSADVRAGAAPAGFKRRAIWMQDVSQWTTLKQHVKDGSIAVNTIDPANFTAIGITMSNKLAAEVPSAKTPDFIIMELAFVKASQA